SRALVPADTAVSIAAVSALQAEIRIYVRLASLVPSGTKVSANLAADEAKTMDIIKPRIVCTERRVFVSWIRLVIGREDLSPMTKGEIRGRPSLRTSAKTPMY